MAYNPAIGDQSITTLKQDTEAFDKFMESGSDEFTDRGGFTRPTLNGKLAQIDAQASTAISNAILQLGYQLAFTFTTGGTLTARNQIVQDDAGNGDWYRWNGPFPKVVAPGTDPASDSDWINVSDGILRSELPDKMAVGGNAVFNSTVDFAAGSSQDGVISDATLLALVGSSTKCRTEGFHAGTTVGEGKYKFLNGADSAAAGYVDGSSRFQIRALDVYACLVVDGGEVDITQFGAFSGSAVDIYVSAAVDFATAIGGYIYVPAGIFSFSFPLTLTCNLLGADWFGSKLVFASVDGVVMSKDGITVYNVSIEGDFDIGETVILDSPPSWQSNPYYTTSARSKTLTSTYNSGVKLTWRSILKRCRVSKFHRGVEAVGIHSHNILYNHISECEIGMYAKQSATLHKVLVSIVEGNEVYNCWYGTYGIDLINVSFRNNLYEPVLTAVYTVTQSYCTFSNDHIEEAYEGYYFDTSIYNKSALVINLAYLGNRSVTGKAIDNKSQNTCWVFGETLDKSYYNNCVFDSDHKKLLINSSTLYFTTSSSKTIQTKIQAYYDTTPISVTVAKFSISDPTRAVNVHGDMYMMNSVSPVFDKYRFDVNLVNGTLYQSVGTGIGSVSVVNEGGGVYAIQLTFSASSNFTNVLIDSTYSTVVANTPLELN